MKFVIVTGALLASVVSASAADLAPVAAEPVAPVILPFSWTGFYVGAHIGYAWGNENDTLSGAPVIIPPPTETLALDSFHVNGVIGGIHAGYNYQFENTGFVVGLEGDVDASGLNGDDSIVTGDGTSRLSMHNNWQGSIRARLGYAFDRFLVYATGGVAFADVKERWNLFDGTIIGSDNKTRTGWTVGGGVEYAFTDHWIGRAEIRYSDFGKSNYTVGGGARFKAGFDETAGILGISYKF
jgi:outer membrane immunogenic protein